MKSAGGEEVGTPGEGGEGGRHSPSSLPPVSTHEGGRTPLLTREALLGFTPEELSTRLTEHLRDRGQPTYRASQIVKWVYETSVPSIGAMSNLPTGEREALEQFFILGEPESARISQSRDGTVKHLWRLWDGELIESVLIPTPDRLTLCISSQAGCAMGCTFCATGAGGFSRQLATHEIVGQFRAARRWAEEHNYGPITNIVYMGMGEPLANRKAVHPSLSILHRGFGVGARRITVSTVGVVPGIRELAARPEQFGLALSLHAPVEELRRELIPLEKRHPLPELMAAVRDFSEEKGRRVTFEYTMIDGVNDAEELAPKLAELARSAHAFVNLIPYNPIQGRSWGPSKPGRLATFIRILEERGVSAAVRESRGRDIDAACGQLRADTLVQLERAKAPFHGTDETIALQSESPAIHPIDPA